MFNHKMAVGVILLFASLCMAAATPPNNGTTVWAPDPNDANWVNVLSCGAVGDGVTDDVAAFRKAAATGKKMFVPKPPKGTHYKLSGVITITNSVYGDGSMPEIRMYGADGDPSGHGQTYARNIFYIGGYAGSGLIISGLHLNGQWDGVSAAAEWSHCINIGNSSNVTVQFCNIEKAYGDCIFIGVYSLPMANNIVVQNCMLSNPRRCCIAVDGGTNITIQKNLITRQTSGYVSALDLEPDPMGFQYDKNINVINNEWNVTLGTTLSLYNPPANSGAPASEYVTIGGNYGKWPNIGTYPGSNGLVTIFSGSLPWNHLTVVNNVQGPYSGHDYSSDVYISSSNKVAVPTGGALGYKVTYQNNTTTSSVVITWLQKPSWITTLVDTAFGIAPKTPGIDSMIVSVKAGTSADTMKVYIVAAFYWVQEAESGTLVSPMVIVSDASASAGKGISATSGSNTVSPKPEATYSLNTIAGDYYVWLKISIPAGSTQNNYGTYIGFNGTMSRNFLKPRDTDTYTWVRSTGSFNLGAGANQFNIGHGLALAKIDQIVITNSDEFVLPENLKPTSIKKEFIQSRNNRSLPAILSRYLSDGRIEFIMNCSNARNLQLDVYNVTGSRVWSFYKQGTIEPVYQVIWDGTTSQSSPIPSGVYVTKMQSSKGVAAPVRMTIQR